MNSNKLIFEQVFVREFSEMSSVILIIQFNIFQQEKKKRKRRQNAAFQLKQTNQNNTHEMSVKLSPPGME